MKTPKILALIILIYVTNLWGNSAWTPSISFVYNTHNLDLLKHFQKEVMDDITLPYADFKIVEKYPIRPGFQLRMMKNKDTLAWGTFMEFTSTGGRIDYRDYSGKHTIDQILNHSTYGFIAEDVLVNPIPKYIKQYFYLAVSWDNLKIKEKIEIYDYDKLSYETNLYSWGGIVGTGLSITLLQKRTIIKLELGGQLGLAKAFFLEGNKDAYLNSSRGKVSPNWSGAHIAIQFGWDI